VRAGFYTGSNPVPDALLNALFPAIVERHFTLGAGYQLTQRTSLQLSYVRGSEAQFTNPGDGVGVPPVTSTHGQNNLQVMYTFGW
jgi:long-chain fatty acid transport protein